MPLSQDQLEAFAAVARAGTFTRAATVLHLSQPALSRRITALEERLETTLLVRGRGGTTLTDAGRRLLAFVGTQQSLEDELVGDLSPSPVLLRGVVRISGLSSLVPHVVLPALAPFLRDQPAVQLEILRDPNHRVVEAISVGASDYGLSQAASDAHGIVDIRLGDEEYVLVESRDHTTRRDVFLDVNPRDNTTERFLAAQPARLRPRGRLLRSFMHDELGILLAAEQGLGRAVKPRHTITASARVRIDPSFVSLLEPVFLHYRRQRYYGRLHEAITSRIETAVRERLAPRSSPRRR